MTEILFEQVRYCLGAPLHWGPGANCPCCPPSPPPCWRHWVWSYNWEQFSEFALFGVSTVQALRNSARQVHEVKDLPSTKGQPYCHVEFYSGQASYLSMKVGISDFFREGIKPGTERNVLCTITKSSGSVPVVFFSEPRFYICPWSGHSSA